MLVDKKHDYHIFNALFFTHVVMVLMHIQQYMHTYVCMAFFSWAQCTAAGKSHDATRCGMTIKRAHQENG